jgi:hypothetical protein
MSNYRAVAVVTAALRNRLTALSGAVLSGATVTTLRPDQSGTGLPALGINIFMYQVTPNVALRNADMPTRRADGTVVRAPTAAIDLHYLLSFYGNDANFESQILLGAVVGHLHAHPALARTDITDVFNASALGTAGQGDQTIAELTIFGQAALVDPSGLADAVDLVRFTPTELSLEELSKLWSVFLDTPYVLSAIYQAGPVLIEDDTAAPAAAALPVMLPANLQTLAMPPPMIAQVAPATGLGKPIIASSTLSVSGSFLPGLVTTVLIDGAASATLTPATPPAGQPSILTGIALPTTLLSGPHRIQLSQQVPTGLAAQPTGTSLSNIVGFVLQPSVSTTSVDATTRDLTVTVAPPVAAHQTVRLLLNLVGGPVVDSRGAYQLPVASPPGDGIAQFMFATKNQVGGDLPAGTYLLRIQVDGVDSPLTFVPPPAAGSTASGTTGFTAPTVVLT